MTIEIASPVHGEPASIVFHAPGGSMDGIATRVAGAPTFAVGEHVQVTLRATPSGLRLAGLAGGKVVLP